MTIEVGDVYYRTRIDLPLGMECYHIIVESVGKDSIIARYLWSDMLVHENGTWGVGEISKHFEKVK